MRLLATRSSIAPRCSPLSDLDANTIAAAKGYLDEGVTWTIAAYAKGHLDEGVTWTRGSPGRSPPTDEGDGRAEDDRRPARLLADLLACSPTCSPARRPARVDVDVDLDVDGDVDVDLDLDLDVLEGDGEG